MTAFISERKQAHIDTLKMEADRLARTVQRLQRAGYTTEETARYLRISTRTVTRHRKRVLS